MKKLAAYGIAKDEAKFVDRFMDAMEGVDVYILDTGSTDDTVQLLRSRGAFVEIKVFTPWRFDRARNAALAMVPEDVDVCFSFDLDEVPSPGWAGVACRAFTAGVDRLRYKYVWNHNADGSDGISFWSEKCHTRKGWKWVKPVHEILRFDTPNDKQIFTHDLTIHHYADDTKPRTSYLPLLELSTQEEPDDDRNAHYLGREYFNYGMHHQAITELTRHLALPTAIWEPERAASMRYISKSYEALGDKLHAVRWALRAAAEAPQEREPWLQLAKLYHSRGDHAGVYWAVTMALKITERPMTYICDPESWGATLYDLGGIAAYYLGLKDEARLMLRKAYELEPTDPRKLKNLEFVL